MMTLTTDQQEKVRQAEELFGKENRESLAKDFFQGIVHAKLAAEYPSLDAASRERLTPFLQNVRRFLSTQVDPVKIDQDSRIPQEVVDGLFKLGVMSMSIPIKHGGLGFSQYAYCKVIEEIGRVDASLAILVNAHQSIGIKSLILFGSDSQKKQWLPKLVTGEILAAFALTEAEAGSDAGGLQTRAALNNEGTHYILSGSKRYITNGAVAGLLTVMAKVPDTMDKRGREAITAFLVTPDMPGFEVELANQQKCGIKGTITSKLQFKNLRVPVANIIGEKGKGLRLALTLLDFGRITFGASCTGAAKRCAEDAVRHARNRKQFGKALCEFEMVQEKLARISALAFAMESGTYMTAGLIDRQSSEYMVETAILKVFASEALWEIVNETIQVHGGCAYFKDMPYERMMRDARINMIGEGANDVLRTFIALTGIKTMATNLMDLRAIPANPSSAMRKWTRAFRTLFPSRKSGRFFVRHPHLQPLADRLEGMLQEFSKNARSILIKHREAILDRQFPQKRLADAVIHLYLMSCVLSRLDNPSGEDDPLALTKGRYFFQLGEDRFRKALDHPRDDLAADTAEIVEMLDR
jgi:acyl-CoA dehydrogenase family member 9